jgi:hypothetical protein
MSFPYKEADPMMDLTFSGMLKNLKQAIVNFKDKRRGKNSQYSMEDVVLSGFSIPNLIQEQTFLGKILFSVL